MKHDVLPPELAEEAKKLDHEAEKIEQEITRFISQRFRTSDHFRYEK